MTRGVKAWLGTIAVAGALGAAPAAQASKASETFDAAWTIIRDSHFDPTMNGVDWPAVKAELGPRAARAQTDGELRDVIRDMLGRLGLSHFALIPSGRDSTGGAPADLSGDPGFDVRLVGSELLVTQVDPNGGAAAAGVRPGWRLLSLDSMPVSELLSRLPETMPDRLRRVEIWRMVETRLRGPQGSRASLMFDDGTQDVGVAVERRAEAGQPATVGNLPTMYVRVEADERRTTHGATAGVIRFNVWMPGVDPALPARRRQVPHGKRHRRRSPRQPGRPRGDDYGDLGALSDRSQASRDDEDA